MEIADLKDKVLSIIGKYFKTDAKYLAFGSFWLMLAKAISFFSSLATSVVFANVLTEETYGMYRYVLSIIGILSVATLSGIDTSITKAVGSGFKGSIVPALKSKMKYGVLGGIASLAVAAYYFYQGSMVLAAAFALTAAFIPFMDSFYIYMAYLNGSKNYSAYTKYHLLSRVVIVTVLIGAAFFRNTLILVFAFLFIHTTVRLLIFIKVKSGSQFDESRDPAILTYGKHLSVMNAITVISTSLDKILIFHFAGAGALAGYYLSLIPYKQVQDFFRNINTLALPKFSGLSKERLRTELPVKIIRGYIFIVPVIIAYVIAAPFLFKLLYPKYIEFVSLSEIFMLQLLLYPISLFQTAITSWGDKRKLYFISTTYTALRISLLIILVPLFGLAGAVATILSVSIINSLITTSVFFRFTPKIDTSNIH